MSPTEDQLRRALREGEGDGPDPDAVISRAVAYRGERRTKMLAAAAVVAVVAGVGTGIGFATTSGPGSRADHAESQVGGAAGSGYSAKSDNAQSAPTAAQPAAGAATAAAACPARLPAIPRAANNDAQFFDQAVTSVTICGYTGGADVVRNAATQQPLSSSYGGSEATAIARAIAAGSTQPGGALSCGVIRRDGLDTLLLTATYPTGARAKPVLVGVGCHNVVTNGVTTRYSWNPPEFLAPFVIALNTATNASRPAVGPSPATS